MAKEVDESLDNLKIKNVNIEKDYKLNLRKETQNFIICYTEFDKKCIDKVSNVLEDNYNRITNNLNKQLNEKLTIEIHPDHNELHMALGFPNAPDWVRGGIGVGKIVIASPLNPPPGSDFYNVLNTAVHEFVHMIVNKINDNTPRWLNEGIACYEAKDNNENWIIKTVQNGLENNIIPTFKELDTGADFETFFARNGYQYSYTIVESIIKLFGYEKLRNLIKEPNSIVEIFGMTEEELQNKWNDYIKVNYLQS
ncbi:peptidase MA family metallohydrolase [Clostridium beijerinckii]|uniref:peptidase MA family metallohydrolase n=1 Tax=Clostridium beijerinckii TaxID=1520 RepID=UPI0003D372FD|nr:peptidase MA family metallohydrolase [Clostridium beijerinckii]ALB45400.1 hypothetical protein X276_08975 [Clostridium beijerinckii NRRL B-598]